MLLLVLAVFSFSQAAFPDEYATIAQLLINSSRTDTYTSFEQFEYLCDTFGPRYVGTPALTDALDYIAKEMEKEGLRVYKEPVHGITNWIRGQESLVMTAPRRANLAILGLGTSVGCKDLSGEVFVVSNFTDLQNNGAKARGKFVLYNFAFTTYGQAVQYRSRGASEAAKYGALAALVRSVTPFSLNSPHTGGQHYSDGVPKIPSLSVTVEDAEMMARMQNRGQTIKVTLNMEAKTGPPASAFNILGEIEGKEVPHEVVVLGGHSDSWDVGQGAMDDGGGLFTSWEAVNLINRLIKSGQLKPPKRSIRVVLWVDEEVNQRGAATYYEDFKDSLKDHVIAFESDSGNFEVTGFGFTGTPEAKAIMNLIGSKLLADIGAGNITDGGADTDNGPLVAVGVPGGSLRSTGFGSAAKSPMDAYYFFFHHSHADMLTHLNRDGLRNSIAAFAVYAYVLADMPNKLPSNCCKPPVFRKNIK